MGRMSMVYDGKTAENLTKDELIIAILNNFKISSNENIIKAMEEAFRSGFLRGEDFGKSTI